MIFSIPSSSYLADGITTIPKGSVTFGQFSDGEWYVELHEDVKDKEVWVLAQTGAPADTLVQLLLLCDALYRAGAQIKIFLSYMGYARQDRYFENQAVSAEVMCNVMYLCRAKQLHALQLHNPYIGGELFMNHIPYPFFIECIQEADIIVAPDKGAAQWAGPVAAAYLRQLISIEKHRPEPEKVTMTLSADVHGKRALIVDDMITTGNTILEATRLLLEQGALSVQVAVTHGLFSSDARKRIEKSKIEKLYVTNSLAQHQSSAKIAVIDIAPFIEEILQK